jgi:mannitol/fructose-specific phosphotransferase system IIA component (Ntr-type)
MPPASALRSSSILSTCAATQGERNHGSKEGYPYGILIPHNYSPKSKERVAAILDTDLPVDLVDLQRTRAETSVLLVSPLSSDSFRHLESDRAQASAT